MRNHWVEQLVVVRTVVYKPSCQLWIVALRQVVRSKHIYYLHSNWSCILGACIACIGGWKYRNWQLAEVATRASWLLLLLLLLPAMVHCLVWSNVVHVINGRQPILQFSIRQALIQFIQSHLGRWWRHTYEAYRLNVVRFLV